MPERASPGTLEVTFVRGVSIEDVRRLVLPVEGVEIRWGLYPTGPPLRPGISLAVPAGEERRVCNVLVVSPLVERVEYAFPVRFQPR